ncbi:MAG TPA: site-specific integrase [Terricaulis sp.]|nr:site-specific integrase [Terricaulis sp.]
MSVYPRKRKDGSTAYIYDFVLKGRRFLSPSGGFETRRKAEAAERTRRQRVIDGKEDQPDDISLDDAAGLWWRDKGQHLGSSKELEGRVERLIALIGARKMLSEIRTATVNDAIQLRRRRTHRNRPPSNSTINRDVIDTLRPIIRYAAKIHELKLPAIAWDDLRLAQPDKSASHREFTSEQMGAWANALEQPIERFFLGLALTYGPRFGEMFFHLDAPGKDAAGAPQLELGRYKGRHGWKSKRKDGSLHPLPIDDEHLAPILALADKARAAGLDTIWFDESAPDLAGRVHRTEITYWGMHHRLRKAAEAAGVPPGRLIHGMRHHAGSAILRATRDIMMANRLLGHSDIATTQRYAQIDNRDLRGGLARVSRPVPEAISHALLEPPKKQQDSD